MSSVIFCGQRSTHCCMVLCCEMAVFYFHIMYSYAYRIEHYSKLKLSTMFTNDTLAQVTDESWVDFSSRRS